MPIENIQTTDGTFFYPFGGNAFRSGRRYPLDGVWMHEAAPQGCAPADGRPEALDAETFADVVEAAPLISIDLIVRDETGALLLGFRRNPPARGCWFVPGGRIRKNERLDAAFHRICCDELGEPLQRSQARFMGVYEHFYDTNFRGTAGATTHYVVHAYLLQVERATLRLPTEQHSDYAWMHMDAAAQRPDVHANTKAYIPILRG